MKLFFRIQFFLLLKPSPDWIRENIRYFLSFQLGCNSNPRMGSLYLTKHLTLTVKNRLQMLTGSLNLEEYMWRQEPEGTVRRILRLGFLFFTPPFILSQVAGQHQS